MFIICIDTTDIDGETFTSYSALCCTALLSKIDNATKYATQELAEKRLPRIKRLASKQLFTLLKHNNFEIKNIYVKRFN